jgi:hypothetical protein
LCELIYREYQYPVCSVHHCGMFVVHGSKASLKIAEWGRARRFYENRIGVGNGAFLDYFQDLWEVFIIGEVYLGFI